MSFLVLFRTRGRLEKIYVLKAYVPYSLPKYSQSKPTHTQLEHKQLPAATLIGQRHIVNSAEVITKETTGLEKGPRPPIQKTQNQRNSSDRTGLEGTRLVAQTRTCQ